MASITTGLTQLMSIYYDKVFLDRAEAELKYDWGAQKRNIPMNSGRYNVLPLSTVMSM